MDYWRLLAMRLLGGRGNAWNQKLCVSACQIFALLHYTRTIQRRFRRREDNVEYALGFSVVGLQRNWGKYT